MLSIKQLFNQFFKEKKQEENQNNYMNMDKDSVVMSLGLTPNYEIDLSIEIKDLYVKDKSDLHFKAQKIASFFYTITSGGLNKTIIEFLLDILPDKHNQELFESILYNWLLLEQNQKSYTKEQNKNTPLVEPSKAFIPYFNK